MKNKFRKIILACLIMVGIGSGGYFSYRLFGPGWRWLTRPAGKCDFSSDPSDSTGRYNCRFIVDDTALVKGIAIIADDEKEAEVYLNGTWIMQCNGFYYYPGSRKKQVYIHPYFNAQPHLLDEDSIRKLLRSGENTLSFHFKREPDDSTRMSNWGMVADVRSWSLNKRNYSFQENHPWQPASKFTSVRINVPGHLIPDEPKVKGSIRIIRAEGDTFRSPIRIEARGRSTLLLMQKSFGFKLATKDRNVSEKGIPGLGKGTDWVLYAPSCDLSMVRNVIAYDLFRDMGHYSVRYEPVELIINNRYRGIYYLMQRVSVGPDRVAIRFDSTAVNDTANSAFLVQIDAADSNDIVIHQWWSHFLLQKPGKKMPPMPYAYHVGSRLETMLRTVYKRQGSLDKIIDYDSFTDYILLQELTRNYDAYRLSTYLYKDHDSIDPRIHAGPPWDFNLAYGLPGETEQDVYEGWMHEQREKVDSFWTILFNRPDFNKALSDRYRFLRKGLLSQKALSARIQTAYARLKPAVYNNLLWLNWPKKEVWPYKDVPESPEAELLNLENFLNERLLWMDEQLLSDQKRRAKRP